MANTESGRLGDGLQRKTALRWWAGGRAGVIAGCTYALLVLVMWGPLGWKQGLPAETMLVYTSQTMSTLRGFWWPWAGLRMYVSFFYHAAYVLAEVLGIKGSFLPYQLVYIGLIWGRGFLAFIILRRVLKGELLFSFLAGALLLLHGCDTAMNWAGNINTQGMILWMMLSIYSLVRALETRRIVAGLIWLGASVLGAYLALWTYESELFIIVVIPVLLMLRYGFNRRTIASTLVYWIAPAIYVVESAKLYLSHAGSGTYQEQIMRPHLLVGSMLGDLWFYVQHSLAFWAWPQASISVMSGVPYYSQADFIWLWAVAVVVLGGGIWLIGRQAKTSEGARLLPSVRKLLILLGVGVLLLVLSFPAFLLLNRTLWRTEFLSVVSGYNSNSINWLRSS